MVKKRTGAGIIAYLVLLFSLVLSLGSLYFFVLHGSIRTPDQSVKYTTIIDKGQVSDESEVNEGFTFVEAILDLKQNGYQIVYVKDKIYLDNPQYIGYEEFKSKTLEIKTVFVTPSDLGIILLVQIKNDQWIWIPS